MKDVTILDPFGEEVSLLLFRSDCPKTPELLAHALGKLGDARRTEIEQHLSFCALCRRETANLAKLQQTKTTVATIDRIKNLLGTLGKEAERTIKQVVANPNPASALALQRHTNSSEVSGEQSYAYDIPDNDWYLTITQGNNELTGMLTHKNQPLPPMPAFPARVYLVLKDKGALVQEKLVNERGHFKFSSIAPNTYQVWIDTETVRIEVPDDFKMTT